MDSTPLPDENVGKVTLGLMDSFGLLAHVLTDKLCKPPDERPPTEDSGEPGPASATRSGTATSAAEL